MMKHIIIFTHIFYKTLIGVSLKNECSERSAVKYIEQNECSRIFNNISRDPHKKK